MLQACSTIHLSIKSLKVLSGSKPSICLKFHLDSVRKHVFTYQKWYLKSVHKFRQPLQVVGAAGGQKSEKAKKKSVIEGRLIPLI
jgi:hypothetical protein